MASGVESPEQMGSLTSLHPCAVLLGAGFGTRLGRLGKDQPKALLPVAGRPLLDYLMAQLVELEGLASIHLVSNARFRERFRAWAEPWAERLEGQERSFSLRDDGCRDASHRLGAVADLALVAEGLRRPRLAVVCGTDNLFLFSLRPFWHAALADARHRVLAIRERDPRALRRSAVLEIGPGDRVSAVHEKPANPTSPWASPALYALRESAFDHLDAYLTAGEPRDELGRFLAFLAERETVVAHRVEGRRLHLTAASCWQRADDAVRALGVAKRDAGAQESRNGLLPPTL